MCFTSRVKIIPIASEPKKKGKKKSRYVRMSFPMCFPSAKTRYESNRNNSAWETPTTRLIQSPLNRINAGKYLSYLSNNRLLKIARKDPAAPNPSSATEITIKAKWYHCVIDRICINTNWYAIMAAESSARDMYRRVRKVPRISETALPELIIYSLVNGTNFTGNRFLVFVFPPDFSTSMSV